RTGVCLLPFHRNFEPAHTLHAGHDTDVLALRFENWPLLDVEFEERREWVGTAAFAATIADRRERFAERRSSAILLRARPVGIEDAAKDARSNQRRGEARAFLVGPIDHLDRRMGLVARLNQRPQRLQRSEDAEHAIEFAAGRLGIEMAAHCDRR